MLAKEYLSNDFKPIQQAQPIADARALIQDYKLSHVPVFHAHQFLGNVSDDALQEEESNQTTKTILHNADHFFVTENSSIFDAINTFYTHNCNIVPMFNNEEFYIGFILLEDCIAALSKMPFVSENAVMLVVEIEQNRYAMSEIAKIVESNNSQLFGAIICKYQDNKIQILIKASAENISSVVETFERFKYNVVFRFFNDEKQDLLKERFDHLIRYLNT